MYVYTDPGKHKVPFVLGNGTTETPLSEFRFGGAMRVGPMVIVSFRSLKPQNGHFRLSFTGKYYCIKILGDNLK